MLDTRIRLAFVAILFVAVLLVIALSMRGAKLTPSVPTVDVVPVRTEAVATFAAGLTTTAEALPTPTFTGTAAATQATSPVGTGSGTPSCLGLHFVRDVTVPDNTDMTPAQVFTKSWLVENSGTCPWQPGFQAILIGGVAMGGSPYRLAQSVGPGGTIQVSIKMAAPTNQTGVVQGTWKMSDTNGAVFGDYLSVVVVVGGPTQRSPTTTATATTATP